MKSMLKMALFGLAAMVILCGLYLGVQSIRLKWWIAPETVQLTELTGDQKATDMRYLLDLTDRVSQADAVWEAAGLDNPLAEPEVWIERARQTASNTEFVDLILQYLVHVGQGGHAFFAYDINFNPFTSLVGDIPKDAFYSMPQWGALVGRLSWYAHANLDAMYRNGHYILARDTLLDGEVIPTGSVVVEVDGLSADAFALQQQYRAHLRYDPTHDKFFIFPLFSIDPGPDRSGWEVRFELPDGALQTVFVPKAPGYVNYRPDESRFANTRCMALNDDVLYVRMLSFAKVHVDEDAETLRDCFASGAYRKVIFDVRGNGGGEVWSYMNTIMAPLIRQPVTFEMTSAVKNSFYQWYGWRFWLFRATHDNELIDPVAHVERIERLSYPPYSEQGWRVVRVTRRVEPAAAPYNFEGQAYVLTDNDALSAADSFAAAMQRTGLAKVAGANTVGWGQGYQIKMPYSLPNSGLLFYMDAELTFNPGGALNNYAGVMPDVLLNESTYPTPYPAGFNRAAILADPWVQWVLAE
ncbi:MAG: hypothetical protein JXB35_01615 [Anaerolineae bacterium]|nr:hypothetical protein [Anaerolineae bacterium]